MWRIYGFILYEIYPSIISLELHLENKQLVTCRRSDNLARIVTRDDTHRTMLTEFFSDEYYK